MIVGLSELDKELWKIAMDERHWCMVIKPYLSCISLDNPEDSERPPVNQEGCSGRVKFKDNAGALTRSKPVGGTCREACELGRSARGSCAGNGGRWGG